MFNAHEIFCVRLAVLWVVCCIQSAFKSVLELRVEEIDAYRVRDCLSACGLLASHLQLDFWRAASLLICISGLVVGAKLLLLVLREVLGNLFAARIRSRTKTLD